MPVLILLLTCLAASLASAGTADILVNAESRLAAHILTYPPADNRGWVVRDVPNAPHGDNALHHWLPGDQLLINGGYFNADFSPTGLYKVDGQLIAPKLNRGLSGLVAIDPAGTLHLLTAAADIAPYPTVIQAGPYVIDPGGTIGIHSDDGRLARRTLLGTTRTGDLIVLVTAPITLFQLAHAIHTLRPDIERLLNLDGGPSTALLTPTLHLPNTQPVRTYIAKTTPAKP